MRNKKTSQKPAISRLLALKAKPAMLILIAAVLIGGGLAQPYAGADSYDVRISELRSQNASAQSSLNELLSQATSFQDAISELQAQINTVQAAIAANEAKQADLQAQITAQQLEIDKQKAILANTIKTTYISGQLTPVEMLATSSDLSDYIDKQQAYSVVQDAIQETMAEIQELQRSLQVKKAEIDTLLETQRSQSEQLNVTQAKQSEMLTYNQGQQDAFNGQIAANSAKITELRRQQILENIKLFGGGSQPGIPGGGGYPWGNAYCVHTRQVGGACPNYDWYFNGGAWDTWGYGYRNCTSWVAYKLALDGKSGFTYLGNAAQWPGNAEARGIAVSYGSGAQVGDAAVNPNGYYGHVMYVEAVNGNQVIISDYNRLGDGLYRGPDGGNAAVVKQSSLVFIHF